MSLLNKLWMTKYYCLQFYRYGSIAGGLPRAWESREEHVERDKVGSDPETVKKLEFFT